MTDHLAAAARLRDEIDTHLPGAAWVEVSRTDLETILDALEAHRG